MANSAIILDNGIIDFKVISLERIVELYWIISEELNSDTYILEKSYDGISFTELNVDIEKNGVKYFATDNKSNQIVYYRIKQTDELLC